MAASDPADLGSAALQGRLPAQHSVRTHVLLHPLAARMDAEMSNRIQRAIRTGTPLH